MTSTKIAMTRKGPEQYYGTDHSVLAREYETRTPNGNKMNGRWVLRNAQGAMIDFDQYSNDIAERNNLKLL